MTQQLENETAQYMNFFNQLSGETDDISSDYETKIKSESNRNLIDLLASTFPLLRKDGMMSLEYIDYDIRVYSSDGEVFGLSEIGSEELLYRPSRFSEPLFNTYSEDPIMDQDQAFAYETFLIVTLHQMFYEKEAEKGEKSVFEIQEQDVCLGPIPRMTVNSNFMHEGAEKRYAGAEPVIDRINNLFEQAFIGISDSAKENFLVMDTTDSSGAIPYDLIETWPLENETNKFLEELIPINLS